jgi:TPR repeat protein
MSRATEIKKERLTKAQQIYLRGQKQQEAGNLRSGFRLLLAAAKLGDSGAQLNLGYTYDVGIGVRRSRAAAMHWYERAYRTERGWGIAASNIGTIYRDEHNFSEAVRWFRRAARYGDIDANLDLAKIHLMSPRQQDKAVACLKTMLKATPPIGIGEETQREARKLLKKIERNRMVGGPGAGRVK